MTDCKKLKARAPPVNASKPFPNTSEPFFRRPRPIWSFTSLFSPSPLLLSLQSRSPPHPCLSGFARRGIAEGDAGRRDEPANAGPARVRPAGRITLKFLPTPPSNTGPSPLPRSRCSPAPHTSPAPRGHSGPSASAIYPAAAPSPPPLSPGQSAASPRRS